MAIEIFKIATITVGSSGASTIDFTSIPQGYMDLRLVISARGTTASDYFDMKMAMNGTSTTTNWTRKMLENGGTSVYTYSFTNSNMSSPPAATMAANVFGNCEVYIPNYTSGDYKSIAVDSVSEGTTTTSVYMEFNSFLWSNTAAISQITLSTSAGNFAQYSTATLYGIK